MYKGENTLESREQRAESREQRAESREQRADWIDVLKGIGIILVVIDHRLWFGETERCDYRYLFRIYQGFGYAAYRFGRAGHSDRKSTRLNSSHRT